jgi:Flp pilus assembly pilin Flp
METIKRFFKDEAGTAEATSTVVMIAGAGILLAAGLTTWYTGLDTVFGAFSAAIAAWAPSFVIPG